MFALEAGEFRKMFFQPQRMAGQRVGAGRQRGAGFESDENVAFDIFLGQMGQRLPGASNQASGQQKQQGIFS